MKQNAMFSTIKAQNSRKQFLFRFLLILFISVFFINVHAQCPTATASPSTAKICSGTPISIILASDQIGTTYTWVVEQKGIVGAVDGSGSGIEATLSTMEPIPGSVIYTITPVANGCIGIAVPVTIMVNPIPVITATPLTSTITSGSSPSIALTSDVTGTAFSWTVIQSGVSGAKAESGLVINQRLTTAAETGIATYTIIPTVNSCAGKPLNAKVTVKKIH